ncbi:MAG: alpha/beta hydrolase, partial [Rhodospirillaceae bacterium]|nr:alpha/beta hydrolase [Rhodospirillaceae bacterium]
LQHLTDQDIPPARWVLYGESLGTGVAVEMARRFAIQGTPVNAVVLEAPFTSMADAAADHYPYVPALALVRDKFNSLAKIATIKTSLLVFHGDQDRVVAFAQGKTLFEAARDPKSFRRLDGAHHNDLYDFGAAKVVLEFLRP